MHPNKLKLAYAFPKGQGGVAKNRRIIPAQAPGFPPGRPETLFKLRTNKTLLHVKHVHIIGRGYFPVLRLMWDSCVTCMIKSPLGLTHIILAYVYSYTVPVLWLFPAPGIVY